LQHLSNISLNVPISIPPVNYVTVHVTLVATKSYINPQYFNIDSVPCDIATTLPTNLSDAPIFTSLSLARTLPTGEMVYKMFSTEHISDDHLAKLFVDAPIDWKHRKVWQAFPKLDPIDTFAPIELYPPSKSAGLWYTSGIESFISTLETSALSGKNVATLLARRLWRQDTE
jgi:prenylcysteine oxidase / farnesylcysteine lyase